MNLIPEHIYKFLPKSEYLWYVCPLEKQSGTADIVFCTSQKLHKLLLRNIDQNVMVNDKIKYDSVTILLLHSSIDQWTMNAKVGDSLICLLNEVQIEIV